AANARWMQVTGKGPQAVHPPGWCVAAVADRKDYPPEIRELTAVVDHPVLRPDGTILNAPGYDAATGLLLGPQAGVPPVPDVPTLDDAVQARKKLLAVVCDFPFKHAAHRAAWLASLLTPMARYAFDGNSPLTLVDGNAPGVGKGLLLGVN